MGLEANGSDSIRYGLEELKFLKSPRDLRILGGKVAYKVSTKIAVARAVAPAVPPSLHVEPTNICNLRCTTCPGARSEANRGYMDQGLFERIVTDAAEIGVRRIHLFLRGEPMLHPRVFDMCAFIKEKGLAVHLTTNGTRLTPEGNERLLETGMDCADQLKVSFLGHSRETYEAVMVGADRERVIANTLDLVRRRDEARLNGPVIETIFNASPETAHEAGDFLRFWRGKVDHARLGEISLAFQEHKRGGLESIRRRGRCNVLFERLLVNWDGIVPRCNVDIEADQALGDLNRDTIADVWNSERANAIRRIHRERRFEDLPECLHCDL